MNCFKIEIEPTSSFATKFESDTLFGSFCWNLLYKYGENKLKALLKKYDTEPFIIFSNAFFSDELPKPLLKPVISKDKNIKSIKKTEFLNKAQLIGLLKESRNNNTALTLTQINNLISNNLREKQGGNVKETVNDIEEKTKTLDCIIQKNYIDRLGYYSNNKLFAVKETFYAEDVKLNIFVKHSDSITREEIEEIFKLIAVNGFGKDKSTGKGKFKFSIHEEFEEKEFLNPADNIDKYWVMSLSNAYIEDIENNGLLAYQFIKSYVKFPKMGGAAASSGVPFKNPVVLLTPGSTFKPLVKKDYYGNAIKNVFASKYSDHWHSGYIMPFFFIGE